MNEWIPRNTWVAGGIATALLMLWFVTTGDTASGVRLSSDPEALRLLRNAENAAHTTPYEGSQFISSWSRSGMATTSLVKVAHIPGSGTQVRVQGTTADVGGQVFETDDTQQTGGLTGYTPRMLDLLSRNYAVVRAGQDKVCGRPTFVVEARRADGSAAGRFYLDRQTGLMLRREVLDQQGREVTFTVFFEIRLVAPKPQFVPAAATRTIEAPWAHRLAGADLGAMRYHGWPVHTGLPDRLSLYDARQSDGDSPVLHLSYSDGLSVVSVFVQRGILDANSLAGWRRANRGGRTVYLRDTVQQRAMWASEGYVFTVLADAPPPVVDSAVAALPHGDVGFWGRLARGMNRLTAWANPFD